MHDGRMEGRMRCDNLDRGLVSAAATAAVVPLLQDSVAVGRSDHDSKKEVTAEQSAMSAILDLRL